MLSAFNPAGATLVAMMGSVSRRKTMKGVYCFFHDGFIQLIYAVANAVRCSLRVCLDAG